MMKGGKEPLPDHTPATDTNQKPNEWVDPLQEKKIKKASVYLSDHFSESKITTPIMETKFIIQIHTLVFLSSTQILSQD